MVIMYDLTQKHCYDLAKKLVLKKTLQENVVGFTDTLPLLKSVMRNRPKYSQSAIVEDVLGEPCDTHNSLADVNILRRVMMKTGVEPDLMIEHSFTLQWFGSYNNFITHRNVRMATFQPLARKRVVSTGMIVKMASSGLEFKYLAVAFTRGGKDGLISLLTEKSTDNKVRVTNKNSVLNSLTDYFEKISET